MCHAQSQGWSARHTLVLDASVHEDLANILRLEKRHKDALANIIYWVAASRHRPIKKNADKLRVYFNRCKLKNTTLEDVETYLSRRKGSASYSAIQKQVRIPANVTGHSGDRDRFAHGLHAGTGFVL